MSPSEHASNDPEGWNRRIAYGGLVALAASLLAAVILMLAACSNSAPTSPEELFAEVQRLNEEGDARAIWALHAPQSQQDFRTAIDQGRAFLRTEGQDPKNRRFLESQFHVTADEFMTLDYVDLFASENTGREHVMVGASIVEVEPAPDSPGDMRLWWTLRDGQKVSMLCRNVDGKGWYVVRLKE